MPYETSLRVAQRQHDAVTTTMKLCKSCAHWSKSSFSGEKSGFHDCVCPKIVYDGNPVTPDMAIYADYEGYGAGFSTGPDFGCIHWRHSHDQL